VRRPSSNSIELALQIMLAQRAVLMARTQLCASSSSC
jgi:hypothetical protein